MDITVETPQMVAVVYAVLNTAGCRNTPLMPKCVVTWWSQKLKHTEMLVPSKVVIRDCDKAASFQRTFLTAYLCIPPCSLLNGAAPHQFIISLLSLLSLHVIPLGFTALLFSLCLDFFSKKTKAMFSACSVNSDRALAPPNFTLHKPVQPCQSQVSN